MPRRLPRLSVPVLRPVAMAVAAAFTLAACSGGAGDTETAGAIADDVVPSAFAGEYETLSGQSLDLGSLEGKDVVLWFWAPW